MGTPTNKKDLENARAFRQSSDIRIEKNSNEFSWIYPVRKVNRISKVKYLYYSVLEDSIRKTTKLCIKVLKLKRNISRQFFGPN